MPQQLPQIQLQDVVYQQQNATVFNGAAIPAIAAAPEAFIIFYLTQPDEQNGFGTVIQLDAETKQAAIFADLNPEYSHLFYTDEQLKLQTLLWCIEFATRNPDGLFVTHAKVYGRGVTEQELQSMISEAKGQEHQLTEQVSVDPASGQSTMSTPAQPTPAPQPQPAAAPTPAPAPAPQAPARPATQPQASQPATAPAAVSQPPAASPVVNPQSQAATSPIQQPAAPAPTNPQAAVDIWAQPATATQPASQPAVSPAGQPDLLAMEQAMAQTAELNLPPLPSTPATPPSMQPNQPDASPSWNQPAPQPAARPELNLPPLPDLPVAPQPTQWANPAAPQIPDLGMPSEPAQPVASPPASNPAVPSQPSPQFSSPANNRSNAPGAGVNRQPVGRPPKPLMQDRLWQISAKDFTWLKSISRQPIEQNREQLRQRAIEQLQKNKPELMQDVQFQQLFEQAFTAVCITYDLVPGLRHDLLKAVLNGRVVEGILKST